MLQRKEPSPSMNKSHVDTDRRARTYDTSRPCMTAIFTRVFGRDSWAHCTGCATCWFAISEWLGLCQTRRISRDSSTARVILPWIRRRNASSGSQQEAVTSQIVAKHLQLRRLHWLTPAAKDRTTEGGSVSLLIHRHCMPTLSLSLPGHCTDSLAWWNRTPLE